MINRIAWLPCIVFLAIPSLLLAQADRERTTVRTKGVLKGVSGGAIQMMGEDGAQWLVRVDPKSRYNVFQGSANVPFLRPGMFVEFRGTFDKKGKSQAAVRELKVFTPNDDLRMGVKPVSGGLAAGGLFSASDEEDQQTRKKPAEPAVLPFTVTGRIRSIKDNRLVVLAGPAQLAVELAEKVQIAFSIAEFSLVREGDTVEVSGWSLPQQPNHVMATRLTITASKPLGADVEQVTKTPTKVPDLNSLDDF